MASTNNDSMKEALADEKQQIFNDAAGWTQRLTDIVSITVRFITDRIMSVVAWLPTAQDLDLAENSPEPVNLSSLSLYILEDVLKG